MKKILALVIFLLFSTAMVWASDEGDIVVQKVKRDPLPALSLPQWPSWRLSSSKPKTLVMTGSLEVSIDKAHIGGAKTITVQATTTNFERRIQCNLEISKFRIWIGKALKEKSYLLWATVSFEYRQLKSNGMRRKFAWYIKHVEIHPLPFDIAKIRAWCSADFDKRFKASQKKAIDRAKEIISTHPKIKKEDRKKDVGNLARAPAFDTGPLVVEATNVPPVLYAQRIQAEHIIQVTEKNPIVRLYFYDNFSVFYRDKMPPWSSGMPEPKFLHGPSRFLSICYEFDAQGKPRKIQIYGPKEAVELAIASGK